MDTFLKKQSLNSSCREDFLKHLPKNAITAEIGVFKGQFSKHILEITKPKELHLIDVWWKLYGEYYSDWGAYTDFGKLSTKDAYQQVLDNTQSNRDACKFHVGDSLEMLKEMPDQYFDWIYLDSSHSYEATLAELKLLDVKMKPEGIITGHDWTPAPNSQHYGVSVAVKEFCQATNWELFLLDDHIQWAIKRT